MKKILLCLSLAVVLSNCGTSTEKVKVQETYGESNFKIDDYTVFYKKIIIDETEFIIFKHNSTGSPIIINFTKEKLEIKALKSNKNEKRN